MNPTDSTTGDRMRLETPALGRVIHELFAHAAIGIELLDFEGHLLTGNQALRQTLGYTWEELHSKTYMEITHPEDLPREIPLLEQLIARKIPSYVIEKRYLRKGGEPVWVRVTSSIAPGLDKYRISFVENITERKQAEEELRRVRETLSRANADLETEVKHRTSKLAETVADLEHFSYTITHDMRAPLRALQGFSTILLETPGLPGHERDDYLQRIRAAAKRMDALLQDALNYAKISQEQFKLVPIEPEPLLRGILQTYPVLQPPNAEILISSPLPAVCGTEAQLTQCFSNLLTNAVKFVDRGKLPRVRIWAETNHSRVRLWFEDNGIGIAPELQSRIFGMFQRLNKNYEGTGIGLALVKKVAERLGGKIGVESAPGKGSRFWLELKSPSKGPTP
jgi:PAS domain S-box-containing protein